MCYHSMHALHDLSVLAMVNILALELYHEMLATPLTSAGVITDSSGDVGRRQQLATPHGRYPRGRLLPTCCSCHPRRWLLPASTIHVVAHAPRGCQRAGSLGGLLGSVEAEDERNRGRVTGVGERKYGIERESCVRDKELTGFYRAGLLTSCRAGPPGVLGWRPMPGTS